MQKNTLPQAARIIAIEQLNATTSMLTFDISVGALPGQFVNIWLPDMDEKPFSVASDNGVELQVAVAAIGPFTRALAAKGVSDRVGLRGPFGNQFSIIEDRKIVLVGGGFGTAPLHFLGEAAQRSGTDVTMITGARSKDLLMYIDRCEESGFRTLHTTNDGSSGEEGFVTIPLARLLQDEQIDMVHTCGPELMMQAVARICAENNTPCEVSIERYMKCGFGICGQCACDDRLVCKDGCIFPGDVALSLSDFGGFHRGPEGQREAY